MEGMTMDDPTVITVGDGGGSTLLNKSYLDVVMQLPLPGIVIFVHGVNSDGEWFQAAEEGLCKGLNTRMARNDCQIQHCTIEGGKMTPVSYLPDLTADGYLNPKKTSKKFIDGDGHFSPVIHFRWGYKADGADMQTYGDGLYLNEKDYWGGGPFANGCTSIPDLWEGGLSDQLFLWLHAQHLNPTNDRMVYACPHRAYYVVAALRLAKLIGEIRKKQADVPVTIVCHSQGNMVSIAAAFLGDRLDPVTDGAGKTGNCVANTYVLCNPPYSLLKDNKTESWTQLTTGSWKTGHGRQTYEARIGTLKNFFEIIKQQAKAQPAEVIDKLCANEPHGFTAEKDKVKCGYGPGKANYGRVSLYFSPHDQVISSTTIQGIGWRGMSASEIDAANGRDVFCQRVFAQGFCVGANTPHYDFWNDHHVKDNDGNNLKPGSNQFWYPESLRVQYSVAKGKDANRNGIATIMTMATAPIFHLIFKIIDVRINALPDKGWRTPLKAPPLGEKGFQPQSYRFGQYSDRFDEGLDAPGFSRNAQRQRDADDPYGGNRELPKDPRDAEDAPTTDAARGNEATEASLMYEHHAFLRMRARRDGKYGKKDAVTEEDDVTTASDDYKAWRAEKIKKLLVENVATPATDHSSILTNPDHSEKALAYDIPVGVCHIAKEDLTRLRKMADWRFLDGLDEINPISAFAKYFDNGKMHDQEVSQWATDDSGAILPRKVVNHRSIF
jgi:pimeloyl-ACP methyl ester carboxylesterase